MVLSRLGLDVHDNITCMHALWIRMTLHAASKRALSFVKCKAGLHSYSIRNTQLISMPSLENWSVTLCSQRSKWNVAYDIYEQQWQNKGCSSAWLKVWSFGIRRAAPVQTSRFITAYKATSKHRVRRRDQLNHANLNIPVLLSMPISRTIA